MTQTRTSAGERATGGRLVWDVLMMALALLSVGFVIWVEVYDLEPEDDLFLRLAYWDLAIVALFLGEFLWRWTASTDKREFWKRNWWELPGLVPLYLEVLSTQVGPLAWLRAFRLLRVVRVLRLFRAIGALRRLRQNVRFINKVLEESRLGYTLLVAGGVVFAMAAVVFILERDTNDNFATYGDALWWAIVTATTVGYGDITPVTGVARILAGMLMLVGIGLIGIVASSLSTAILSIGQKQEAAGTGPPPPPYPLVDALDRLATLRQSGALTDDEFATAKQKLLA